MGGRGQEGGVFRGPTREDEDEPHHVENEENDVDNNIDEGTDVEEVFENVSTRKKKQISSVWNYGQKVEGVCICNICSTVLSCPQGNTSNLINHIRNRHRNTEEAKSLEDELNSQKR